MFKLIFNRTTIDCDQFDIDILKTFFLGISSKNETKRSFFERGRKKRNVRSQKKRNVDIPIPEAGFLNSEDSSQIKFFPHPPPAAPAGEELIQPNSSAP